MFKIKLAPEGFYIGEDYVSALAHVKVAIKNDILTIISTEVTEDLKGQGAGKQLIKHVVEYCRANGLKVKIKCPFAKKQFEKNPDYLDVLLEEEIQ